MAEISLAAGPGYRRGVIALLLGLASFVLVYLGMLVGCVAAIAVLVRAALGEPLLWSLAAPLSLVFGALGAFLIKGLLHRPALAAGTIPLTRAEQAQLFAFVERLASEAGAPMPAAISLSPSVNAAMLRARSPLGSALGGRTELVIGLGLINVLDLRQLQAVLAHELGHFAQTSTRLGQGAHRAMMIMIELVLGRDRFDDRLERLRHGRLGLARALARLALVGVVGLRHMFGRLYQRIARHSLALAREMEFNADLHAVRLCGSDALIEALWHAQRGAIALDTASSLLHELAKHGRFSDDLYAHQTRRLDTLDSRLCPTQDPLLAAIARPYVPGPGLHFPAGEAPVEITWYAHPSMRERERNAKRPYEPVPAGSWPSASSLLAGAPALRREATLIRYRQLGHEPEPRQLRPAAELERRIDEELQERRQPDHTHGFYDNRLILLGDVDALVEELEREQPERTTLAKQIQPWQGDELAGFMSQWRRVDERLDRLGALLAGQLEVHGFEFELQGERHGVARAPALLAEAQRERAEQIERARAGDRALFRYVLSLATGAQRAELIERARFLVFVQTQLSELNEHRNRLAAQLRGTPNQTEPSEAAPPTIRELLTSLHAKSSRLLDEAERTPMPSLRNIEAGASMREYLLPGALVDPYRAEQPFRAWLAQLMPQVARIEDRMRTLHYKNLGALIELQEQVTLDNA